MTASIDNVDSTGEPRLLFYAPDPDAKGPRRRRRRVLIGLSIFCFFYGLLFAFFAPFLILMFFVPMLLLGLLVIWSLPDINNPPTVLLDRLLFAFVIGMIAWPNYLSIALPGLPWITVVRLTSFPLALILLICTSVSRDFREEIKAVCRETPMIWRLVVAFALVQIVVVPFSPAMFLSLNQAVVGLTEFTAVFFVSVYVFNRPGRVEQMAYALWGLSVFIIVISTVEWRQNHVPWAGHLPSIFRIEDPLVAKILAGARRDVWSAYRVQGTFSTSLGLAEYLAFAVPFILQFAMGQYRTFIRVAAAATIPPLIFIVIVSGSRLGLVGCFITAALYALFWGILKWKRDKASLLGPAVVISYPALFVVGVASTFFIHRLREKFWGNGIQTYSDNARKEQWTLAIPKILSHPQGHGGGTSGDVLQYFSPGGQMTVDSYYITVLLDYGLIGFIVFYGLAIVGMYYASEWTLQDRRESKDYGFFVAIAILLANFLVIKSVFSQPDNHPLIFMALGMLAALVRRAKSTLQGRVFAVSPARVRTASIAAGRRANAT